MRALLSLLLLCSFGCKAPAPAAATGPFFDDFNRAELGEQWNFQGGTWRLLDGKLSSQGDQNVALWLRHPLPRDVEISFEATSASPGVDIKCELFGDGQTHESGYVIINGGWSNSLSIIARLREHEIDKLAPGSVPYKRRAGLQPNKTYQWRIVRRGNTITQYLDGEQYLERVDPEGLYGPQNNKFAFNNWASQVTFDNLRVTPLEPAP